MVSMTHLIVLSSLIISIVHSQSITVKQAVLTPVKLSDNGAHVMFNIEEVSIVDKLWNINILHQNTWQFIIKTDETFGINTIYDSTISLTVNIPDANTKQLLFAFTTENSKYISMSIPMDGSNMINKIYPTCSLTSTTTDFGFGDVASIPGFHRRCDISGGSCNNWSNMLPSIPPHAITTKKSLTFTIKNDIAANAIIFSFHPDSATEYIQKCRFAQDFVSKQGLKIYMAGDGLAETYSISSFNITSSVIRPTTAPYSPTQLPIHITQTPSNKLTENPVAQTQISTTIPTQFPIYNPTTTPIPEGMQFGAHNQLCKKQPHNVRYKCESPMDILSDTMGMIECLTPYDCCLCNTIECGFNGILCEELTIFGEYGMYGVKEIYVLGSETNGVSIECPGSYSCANSVIRGINIGVVECDGKSACQMAEITILNPTPNFVLDCALESSCEGLKINIILANSKTSECNAKAVKDIFMMTKIACNAERACEGIIITIENSGCDKVIIQDLECSHPNSCNNAVFDFIGDIAIENCHCGESCETTTGLEQCFMENINLYSYLCTDPYQCAQQTLTIENPRNGFEFKCSAAGSCRDSYFVIELNKSALKLETVNYLGGILISGDYSAQGTTFLIHNQQGQITMNKIECNGYRSCEFATFITGTDTKVNEIICAASACSNCYVKRTIISDGMPCDASQISSLLQS